MSDIMMAISGLLGNAWRFLMHTFIPGTQIAFGVFFIGFALIPVGFSFLSLAVGHSIGETGDFPMIQSGFDWRVHPRLPSQGSMDSRGSRRYKISDGREHDIR